MFDDYHVKKSDLMYFLELRSSPTTPRTNPRRSTPKGFLSSSPRGIGPYASSRYVQFLKNYEMKYISIFIKT